MMFGSDPQEASRRVPASRRPCGAGEEGCGEALSFEEALAQLETIVTRLEVGDLALSDALQQFEEGIRLSRHCAARLDDAESKIEILLREGGELQTRPFDPELRSTGE
jgi:exodeoxyribonuclease VII small subunit